MPTAKVHRLPDEALSNTSHLVESNGVGVAVDPPGDVDAHLALADRIGYDAVVGWLDGGIEAWQAAGLPFDR